MSLASLLGFVETSHAQGSPVTAIDILLEPDATMVQHARADNARLLKAYPDGFALDATHHPHITMLQQFVRTADLGKVYTAANRILANEKVTSWNLKAFNTTTSQSRQTALRALSSSRLRIYSGCNRRYWMRLRLSRRGPEPLPHS